MAVSFLKKGKAAHEQMDKADQETAKKQAEGSVRRFWLPKDGETQITFLDGVLDDDGLLDTITYWEHQLKLNGHWRNWFACTKDQEPCPICAQHGDSSLIAVFTVIDHSEWNDKQDNVHKNEKRLYACKRETFKILQKIATKRGGLAGATFDVSRIGEKSANVGNQFDFTEKRSASELMKAYGLDEAGVTPYVYEDILVYRTAQQLRELGFGGEAPVGAGDAPAAGPAPSSTDYDKDL